MSALSRYMCFQRCQFFRMSRTLLQAYINKHSHRESYKKTRFPTYSSCLLLYSTQKSGTLKGLTDEILKAKTVAEKENDTSSNDKEKDSKGSKDSKWTGKNAWRLGLLLLGGWSVISGGMILYIWGKHLSMGQACYFYWQLVLKTYPFLVKTYPYQNVSSKVLVKNVPYLYIIYAINHQL